MTTPRIQHATMQIPLMFGVLALLAGLTATLVFLGGDDQGRVNLLYLLLLFVFIPLAGLLLSLLLLVLKSGHGLASWLLALPCWPRHWHPQAFLADRLSGSQLLRRAWLFYVSQLVGFCLGVGSLLAFMLILLGTDVSFVWRSTLLQAEDLVPVLQLLALPWRFWPEAQPSLALLQMSQDFRLGAQVHDASVLGQWWRFALAAQCTFNLLPRGIMLVLALLSYRYRYQQSLKSAAVSVVVSRSGHNQVPAPGPLANLAQHLGKPYLLLNWAQAAAPCVDYISRQCGAAQATYQRGEAVPSSRHALVVLVKGWEPPMGELLDYLQTLPQAGYVLPLDWDEQGVKPLSSGHLQEWRRFTGQLGGWSVLQPGMPA